ERQSDDGCGVAETFRKHGPLHLAAVRRVRPSGGHARDVRVRGRRGQGLPDSRGRLREPHQFSRHGRLLRRRGERAPHRRGAKEEGRPAGGRRARHQGRPRPPDRRFLRRPDAPLRRAQPEAARPRPPPTLLPPRPRARELRAHDGAGWSGGGSKGPQGRGRHRAPRRGRRADRHGDPVRRDRPLRGGHHPQPLHARGPQRRTLARCRRRKGHSTPQRRPLRQRHPREGSRRLRPLRLRGGPAGDGREGPRDAGGVPAVRRPARRRRAAVLDAGPPRGLDHRRHKPPGEDRPDAESGRRVRSGRVVGEAGPFGI
ncbi:MAG: Aldo/keto reductase, partial [uncultured Rubrobacteraceae bacterium]